MHLRTNFGDQNFGIDPKQMDELNKQMQEWQKQFNGKPFVFDQKQMDELKHQLEEMQDRNSIIWSRRLIATRH